ncbi:hypothetical protein Mx4_p97 [Myxococcus phage Mx4]|nr:hypothetical protein Mx4_p97 [Myxococcus phage Mx4]
MWRPVGQQEAGATMPHNAPRNKTSTMHPHATLTWTLTESLIWRQMPL